MLVDIDSKNDNAFIIEELDEEHILVKETKIAELKARLQSVCRPQCARLSIANTSQMMKERLKEPESSDSE